jgi:hypothetical protein
MPLVSDQIFYKSPVLYRIFKMAEQGNFGMAVPSLDGREIVEPVEFAETVTATLAVGAYSKTDEWTAGSDEILKGAAYDWKMYHATIKIHNFDTAINEGKARIFDLAALRIRNAVKKLRTVFATDLYTETYDGSSKIVGLPAMCNTTGTIGAIARSSYSWWQANTNTTTGANRDLTWTLLNDMYYHTKKYGDNDPATLIVTSEGVLQNYEDKISLTNIASTETGSPLRLMAEAAKSAGPRILDGGFEAFTFKKIPMVADPFCPANTLYFLNENYLAWRILKQFGSSGWKQLEDQGKDWAQMTIKGYGAFTVRSPRKLGKIGQLTEA